MTIPLYRDIVVRALAEDADVHTTPVAEICSRDLTTIEPTASVGQAVRLMREKAIRRLPVVDENGFVLGIVPTTVGTGWARSGIFEWTDAR